MDAKLAKILETHLSTDDRGAPSPRLIDDAKRLVARLGMMLKLSLTRTAPAIDVLELCCYALQLPMRQTQLPVGRYGQLNFRQRAEQSAELLVTQLGDRTDPPLLDRCTAILLSAPDRSPTSDEARLLADAVNLEDFGLLGLLNTCVIIASQGQGVATLLDGAAKREAYGYWEARLRDGFHYNPVRAIAERRLASARKMIEQMQQERAEEQ